MRDPASRTVVACDASRVARDTLLLTNLLTYEPVALRGAGVPVERVVAKRDDEGIAFGGAAAQRLAKQRLVLGPPG